MCFSLFWVVLRSLNTTPEDRVPYARHAGGDIYGGKGVAFIEGIVPYARQTFREFYGGEGAASGESRVPYTRDIGGDVYGGEGAKKEGIVSYACYVVCIAVIRYRGGNNDISCIIRGWTIIYVGTTSACNLYACLINDVVVDAACFEVVCPREGGGEEKDECGECPPESVALLHSVSLFHNEFVLI